MWTPLFNTNLLVTGCEGSTGEYWPEIHTTATEGQYSPVRLELARLVSSLLYGTQVMLALNLPAFENKKYTVNGEILTEKEPIRMLGFTLPYNNAIYF